MPLHTPPGYRCPLCAYVRGERDDRVGPEHVVERTARTLTYVSPRWWPNNPGNLLVIPTAHHENLYELPDALGVAMQRAARRAAAALKLAYGCGGVSTRQHNEPAGDQEVWHYHLHVLPRHDGDGLYGSRGEWADRGEMADRAERLRAVLDQVPEGPRRPRVVCLSGSIRFREEFLRAHHLEALAGRIVLGPGVFPNADDEALSVEQVKALTGLHDEKITMADEVLVIDPGGYVGDATAREVALATRLGLPVRYWSAGEAGR